MWEERPRECWGPGSQQDLAGDARLVGWVEPQPWSQEEFFVRLPRIGKGAVPDGLLAPQVPSGADQGFLSL